MRIHPLTSMMLALLIFLASAGANTAARADSGSQQPGVSPPTDRIIIRYRPSTAVKRDAAGRLAVSEMAALGQRGGATLAYAQQFDENTHVLQMDRPLPVSEVQRIARNLADDPNVLYAEPDYILTTQLVPNDPGYGSQWHYTLGSGNYGINLPAAWDITTGSSNVNIAVVDSGSLPHPDLLDNLVPGYDFVSGSLDRDSSPGWDSDPSDPGTYGSSCSPPYSVWHGLHVMGTIGAKSNNSASLAGVNWQVGIVPVRSMGICGSGYSSDIIFGTRWAAGVTGGYPVVNTKPARVINLSLGGLGACSTTYQTAIDEIRAAGSVVVVAAGNNNGDASNIQPANCQGVITVAATNRAGNKANYSSYGSTVEISAPGGEMSYSSDPNGILSLGNSGIDVPAAFTTALMRGTSMAAPHVSGVIGLMLSVNSELTPDRITQVLQKRSTPFPASSSCTTSICGAGILNAGAAVQEAQDLFRLKYPSEFEIAYAGKSGALRQILIRTYENGVINSGSITATIGGTAATVVNAVDRGNYWEAAIQPPNKANGTYDITVTINGVSATHQKSVIYGTQTFLPNVRR